MSYQNKWKNCVAYSTQMKKFLNKHLDLSQISRQQQKSAGCSQRKEQVTEQKRDELKENVINSQAKFRRKRAKTC